jgi:protein gp37
MSDLFHKDMPDDFVRRLFARMVRADRHTYQIRTKRPQRLARLGQSLTWPPHIRIGVSVESYAYAWRVDYLRQVLAAVRFISAEPVLGPVDELNLEGLRWSLLAARAVPDTGYVTRHESVMLGTGMLPKVLPTSTSSGAAASKRLAVGSLTAARETSCLFLRASN